MEPSSTEGGAEGKPVRSLPHKVILKHGQELEEEQEELAEHQPLEQEDLNFERWKRRPIPKRTLHQKIDDLKKYLWNAETNEFMGRSGKSWSAWTIQSVPTKTDCLGTIPQRDTLFKASYWPGNTFLYILPCSPQPLSQSLELVAKLSFGRWRTFFGMSHTPDKLVESMVMEQPLGLILLFYAGLYLFLAAMFGGCLFCLMWSISPYHPTYNDRVMPPGMTMAPHLEGHEIAFNASDRKSWKKYARSMEEYLRPYNDAAQQRKNIPCDKETYFMQDDLDETAERKACQFKRSWLGDCSGMQDPHYGYSQGRPCILLRMNRILGYLPGQGKPINVTCGVKKGPPEALGEIQFFPKSIFDMKYYPYYGKLRHVNYSSPVVAVRFAGVQQDTHIQVQCKLNGKGIINDSPTDRYLGSVTFSLEVGA